MHFLRPLRTFDCPIPRLQFLLYSIICNAIGFMAGATAVFLEVPYAYLPLIISALFLGWTNIALTANRLCDLHYSPWHLSWIIPLYLLPTVWVNFVERGLVAIALIGLANLVSVWLMISPGKSSIMTQNTSATEIDRSDIQHPDQGII